MAAVTASGQVRDSLVDALELDLIGPTQAGLANANLREVLDEAPSRFYLTGFLAPKGAPQKQVHVDDNDEMDGGASSSVGRDDAAGSDRPAAAPPKYLPSSIGLTVLLEPGVSELQVKIRWGDYVPSEVNGNAESKAEAESSGGASTRRKDYLWTRRPHEELITVSLAENRASFPVPHSSGPQGGALEIVRHARRTRLKLVDREREVVAASIFLINRRIPTSDEEADAAFAFQVSIELTCSQGFVARPDMKGYFASDDDWDARLADLHYGDVYEFAVGRGCSVKWEATGERCTTVASTFLPSAGVERVVPNEAISATRTMEDLGKLADGAAVRASLDPMVDEYRNWIRDRRLDSAGLPTRRKTIADRLLDEAERSADRIADGIVALESDLRAFEAFRIVNRAMERAQRQRRAVEQKKKPEDVDAPRWRPFQLAFLLLNIRGIVTPTHPDRAIADLLFFPTGGGKTEAYLGLAAFTMVLRRLRNPGLTGAGVTVIMRYTLRLLTLDQLGRAAALMCALELERAKPENMISRAGGSTANRLGDWPFEVGLWVGRAATPNRMGGPGDRDENCAYKRWDRFVRGVSKESPIPLKNCPWCDAPFGRQQSFRLIPNRTTPRNITVFCDSRDCDFAANKERSLPIVAVDEPIYRRLPAFLVATVDKFAALPWVGETASFFGRANRFEATQGQEGFFGPSEPGVGFPLDHRLLPPELIIQDELHLISGPLGSIAGIYETAIDALCSRNMRDDTGETATVRPKVIASTATVRRATAQIKALFGRLDSRVFPPPGISRSDSFFAQTSPRSESDQRLYIGLAAQGRSPKVIFLKAMLSIMAAAQAVWDARGGRKAKPSNPVDPYMTAVCYFNALKELGSARRIVDGEIQAPLTKYGTSRKRVSESNPILGNREIKLPQELTSRESNDKVAETKRCLAVRFDAPGKEHQDTLDVALATNMISVGLDITRLGLMIVSGQPKAAAEYIQATSRVGREENAPGLVITLLNIHKPRDRSHYEHFPTFHAAFYRAVEAATVAPFVPRSLDRALAAAVVALARLEDDMLTPNRAAVFARDVAGALPALAKIFRDRAASSGIDLLGGSAQVEKRAQEIFEAWVRLSSNVANMAYTTDTQGTKKLLKEILGANETASDPDELLFRAPRSMRDVEPEVRLKIQTLKGIMLDD